MPGAGAGDSRDLKSRNMSQERSQMDRTKISLESARTWLWTTTSRNGFSASKISCASVMDGGLAQRRLAAEHFAGILVATAPDDPVTFDLSVGNLKPVLMSWVGAAIAEIAWKNLIPTPDTYEEVLASAQAAHAAGALFKNVKGRQPPEFAPEPEEAEVDDFDAGDESQAKDC